MARKLYATDYEAITVSTGAVGLTPPNGNVVAYELVCESNDIRYQNDGTDPTASTGTPMSAGDTKWVEDIDPNGWSFIAQGSDATLHVHYYEER